MLVAHSLCFRSHFFCINNMRKRIPIVVTVEMTHATAILGQFSSAAQTTSAKGKGKVKVKTMENVKVQVKKEVKV